MNNLKQIISNMPEDDKRDFFGYMLRFAKANEAITKGEAIDVKKLKATINDYIVLSKKYNIDVEDINISKGSELLQPFILMQLLKVYNSFD